jgi:hypothetical protein
MMGLLRDFAAATFVDLLLHPLHIAEARFILQNNSSNFRVYRGAKDFMGQTYREWYKGISLHIPRNLLMAMSKLLIFFTSSQHELIYIS